MSPFTTRSISKEINSQVHTPRNISKKTNSQAYNTRNINKEMNLQCYTCTNSTSEIVGTNNGHKFLFTCKEHKFIHQLGWWMTIIKWCKGWHKWQQQIPLRPCNNYDSSTSYFHQILFFKIDNFDNGISIPLE